jgi:8-oxo-dGTP pyrophosphatase MutT (NUDIX family)
MTGMARDQAPRVGTRYITSNEHPLLRPKDAASIILLDRAGPDIRFLVGKRARAHTFMPNFYVFPGGRRDRADSRVGVAKPLKEPVIERLMARTDRTMTTVRAQALAVAAIRETFEEAGLIIAGDGKVGLHSDWTGFSERGLAPDLSALRYVARAITPPRQSRRFDTRFFACFLDEIGADPKDVSDSEELQDLTWIGFAEVDQMQLPRITLTIIDDLQNVLGAHPELPYGQPVPFYYVKHGTFVRDII